MLTPRSRGTVTITSPHPSAKPMIVHDYFGDPADLAVAVEGVRIALDISRRPALEPYTTTPFRVPASDSAADVEAFVRAYAHSTYHPAGTCAIGSVVDATLQVQGVAGLRVVDASVMPSIVRGNPNAAVIAIAERAAGLIAGDRR
jgi:choline dehydrogenase-like flavoprotein